MPKPLRMFQVPNINNYIICMHIYIYMHAVGGTVCVIYSFGKFVSCAYSHLHYQISNGGF